MERLNVSVRKFVDSVCKRFADVYGEQLRSIIVYGSALTSYFDPKKSDVNLLIILDSTDISQLKKSLPLMRRYKRINPLFVTKEYIRASQDVYPMEFLEMKDNYVVVYGEDVLQDINIDRQYLRLECEQQLKGALLKLKQGFLSRGMGRIGWLMKDSISTIVTIFRNLIRLKGKEPPVDKDKVIEEVGTLYSIDKALFKSILRYKLGKEKLDLELCFDKYIKELEELIEVVDRL